MELFFILDQNLFHFVNSLPHSAILDSIAMQLSGIGQWGAVWFLITIVLFLREETRDHWFFLPSVLAAAFSLFIAEIAMKQLVARPRPFVDMSVQLVAEASNYSFPSTHATLAFAFAYVLSHTESRLCVWFYLLAGAIALSRVYLGVHYPSDIVGGAFLGIIIGWFSLTLESFAQRRWMKKSLRRSKKIR